MHEIGPMMEEQWAKRRQFYPRSASACEAVIRRIGTALDGRQPFFRNADRLNLLLGLAALEYAGLASEAAYSNSSVRSSSPTRAAPPATGSSYATRPA